MDEPLAVRPSQPHPLPVLAVLAGGGAALIAGVAAGGDATAAGALVFLGATLVALGQTTRTLVTWPNAFLVFVGVMWLVPIKLYRLPVSLPFHLELYRVLLLVLVAAFAVNAFTTKRQVDSLGVGRPLFVFTAALLASQIINAKDIDVAGEGQSLKSLSLVLSIVVVFLLVASTITTFPEIEKLVIGLVLGGTIVALAAIYEGRTHYNVFNHLSEWVPVFDRVEREVFATRGGRLRVHSSAQHPIALGAALMVVLPLAVFLVLKAKSLGARALWVVCIFLIVGGAASTVSRTTVAMAVAMGVVALLVRRQLLIKALPLLLVLPFFIHAVAPGAIGGLLSSFGTQQGTTFVGSFSGRSGQTGSGRLADVEPGLDLWASSPIVGLGLDNPRIAVSGADVGTVGPGAATTVPLIFDNQYLRTLVTLGVVGLIGLVWFVWLTVTRLVRAARRHLTVYGDFIAACSAACAGYGVAMFFFDSMSFIQVTLLFFVTAALGLRAVRLAAQEEAPVPQPVPASQLSSAGSAD